MMDLLRLLVFQPEFIPQYKLRLEKYRYIFPPLHICPCDLGGLSQNIEAGLVLMHGIGVVINGATLIGKNCTILHGVTIGAGRGSVAIIGNNCYIGVGAIIIGKITIGNNVKIGAGAIVVNDVPDNATMICDKFKIIMK